MGEAKGLLVVPVGWNPSDGLEALELTTDGFLRVYIEGGSVTVSPHNLLDGSVHPDTVAHAVAKGDLIAGILSGGTPKWQALAVGADGEVLTAQADGTVAFEAPSGAGFQIWGGTGNTQLDTTTTDFLTVSGWIASNAVENTRQAVVSRALTLTEFQVHLVTAPGAGNSRAFTVRKNGVATAATVTISGTGTDSSWSGSVAFAAGDLISIQQVPTSGPTASYESHALRLTE